MHWIFENHLYILLAFPRILISADNTGNVVKKLNR